MNLDEFIADKNLRNIWIREYGMDVYVRKSIRLLDVSSPTMCPCLDIGSVEVDEDMRGDGFFTTFLGRFEKEAKKLNRAVYAENILEPRLAAFLIRRGYKLVPGSYPDVPSMFKLIP